MAECERLKNDLAYNQCLANFGPAARSLSGGSSSQGGYAPSTAAVTSEIAGIPVLEEQQLAMPGTRSRRGRQSRRGGRESATFEVGSSFGSAEAGQASPSRRSRRRR